MTLISWIEGLVGGTVTDFDTALAAAQSELAGILGPNAALLEVAIASAFYTAWNGLTADAYSKLKSLASLAVAKAIADGQEVIAGTATWSAVLADFESFIGTELGINANIFSKEALEQLISNAISFVITFGVPLVANQLLPILGPIVTQILGSLLVANP